MRLPAIDMPMLRLVTAFVRTRYLAHRWKTRADIKSWQERRIRRWLSTSVAAVDYYLDRPRRDLADLPVIDKAVMMADFAAFNRIGMTADDGWSLLANGSQRRGFTVGASSGTSGNRGLYVISDAERFEWLGVMLGKLLPTFPLETARIALALPRHTPLYSTANRTTRLKLAFFDLRRGVAAITSEIVAYAPDTIIAPPKLLRFLAENDRSLRPKRLFSTAETLDPVDRATIEARYGQRLGQIYMATEGLLATSCSHGMLHLAEDVMHFELQPVEGSTLVSPVISDFIRGTQVMARYKMNDLLRLGDRPCPCGSPLRAVAEVVGRRDDIFVLPAPDGRSVTVTPDVLRNAILDADRGILDFRLVQTGLNHIDLSLPLGLPSPVSEAACAGLRALFHRLALTPEITVLHADLAPPTVKLRRVERRWSPEESLR